MSYGRLLAVCFVMMALGGGILIGQASVQGRAFVRDSFSDHDDVQISAFRHQKTGACFVVVRTIHDVYAGKSVSVAVTPAASEVCR